MKVYEKINAFLTANSIDPADLSGSTGIPKDRIGSMLNGKETLYAKDLKAICLALNVSPELFIEVYSASGENKI